MLPTGQRTVVFFTAVVLAAWLIADEVAACGGKAVPPSCGRTVVITGASPNPVLTTGGTFDLDQLIYFGLVEFPAGSGQCPPGPFLLDIDVRVTCTPAGDAVASVSALPIVPGYTDVPVSVVIPAGPPRICAVESTATVTSGDGAEITSTGDGHVLCVSEIVAPGVPRLELVPPLDPILFVHPGDQSHHLVRLINNDPTATFTGTLDVETQNRSKVPGLVPSGAPGDDVFSASDPGDADNFPIAFADDIAACVPLPPDPLAATIPTLGRPIVLGPGESTEVEILTRPWGMCSGGSCSQSKMVVTGDFSDVTTGLACTSFVTATDLVVPPTFLWPDAGASALVQPPLDPSAGALLFVGQPTLESDPLGLLMVLDPPQLAPPLLPPVAGGLFAEPLDPERGRWRATFDLPQPIQPDDPFQIVLPMQFQPEPGGVVTGVELLTIEHLVGAPIGFDTFQPLFMGTLGLTQDIDGLTTFSEMQFTMQLTLFTLDPLGQPSDPLPIVPLPPVPGLSGLDLSLQAMVPSPPPLGAGSPPPAASRFQVDVDVRFHAARGAAIFSDGFDSGSLEAWSAP